MIWLRQFFDTLFKCFQAKFSPTSIAKALMDDTYLDYFFFERKIIKLCNFYYIYNLPDNLVTREQKVTLQNRINFINYLIREAVRDGFIFHCEHRLLRYLSTSGYKTRVEVQFFTEEYALELFPPLPTVEHLAHKDASKSGDRRQKELDIIHDIKRFGPYLYILGGIDHDDSLTPFNLRRIHDCFKGNGASWTNHRDTF